MKFKRLPKTSTGILEEPAPLTNTGSNTGPSK